MDGAERRVSAREAWEGEGYTVKGAALSGIAAENGVSLAHRFAHARELHVVRRQYHAWQREAA